MDANRYLSVSYDVRHNPKLELLRRRLGCEPGRGDSTLGCWVALLCIMYDTGRPLHVNDPDVLAYLTDELMLASDTDTMAFLSACAACDLIDAPAWEDMHAVFSESVQEELDYRRQKSDAGKKGGRPRKKHTEKHDEKQVL